MPSSSVPRLLLPRRRFPLFSSSKVPPDRRPPSLYRLPPARRYASSQSKKPPQGPGKGNILEKPARFNPPSHGARLNKKPPRSYPGPPLSAEEARSQKTKQYPHMMPPAGTFTHWFLNNRTIHVYITLGTLFSLALFTTLTNFRRTSPFADMLPPSSDVFFHPLHFVGTYFEVFRMHTAHTSAETAERRKRKVDDAMKRKQYRKAHGLESGADEQGEGVDEGERKGTVGGWFSRLGSKDEGLVVGRVGGPQPAAAGAAGQQLDASPVAADSAEVIEEQGRAEEAAERRKRPAVKKWFGIWS